MSAKSRNLAVLAAHGIRVPRGFALNDSHYSAAVAPVMEEMCAAARAGRPVGPIVEGVALPEDTGRAIEAGLAQMPDAASFAVRSAGTVVTAGRMLGEDGSEVSLAGQFDSLLSVPRKAVSQAVQRCWASLFNARSLARFGPTYVADSKMSVLVQEYVPAKAAFVAMTVDPQGGGDFGALEFTWGACEGLVSGAVTPDEVTFSRSTRQVLSRRLGLKELRLDHRSPHPLGEPAVRQPTSPGERAVFALDDATVRQLIDLCARVEGIFSCPQDIEGVVDAAGRVVVTQARPVTALPARYTPFPIPEPETCS